MTIQDLGSLGEFVAAIATIATLIYLAIQIRQNAESVQTAAEVSVSQKLADWAAQVVNDSDLGRIWDVAATDPESLSEDEVRRFIWFVAQLFMLYEGQFSLFLKGHISARTWDAKAQAMLGLLQNQLVTQWWDSRIAALSPKFIEYIDSRRDESEITWAHKNVYEATKSVS